MSREYRNDGRDQISIENTRDIYIGDQRSRTRPDKETKWLRAFEKEITGRLTTSLHNQILINLGKEIDLDQVRRLWDMEVKSGQVTEAIAPDTEILSVFDQVDIQGKLLMLGKPGAGKTTTLLELAKSLVTKAIDDPIAPMPILLNLSSWKDPRQSIRDWAIAELSTKGVGSKISAKWLDDQKLLPLLDGLDEVRSDLQAACVSAINLFMTGEGKPEAIVVCSRREEYELYPEKLDLNGAIYLQELSDAQIEAYLEKVDRLSLWEVLGADADLLELVRQPLLLSITLIAYRKELAERWQALQTTQARLEFLLDAYVGRMLHRTINSRMYTSEKEPTAKQTRQWLVRLAKQLHLESETEFLVERIQPSWLTNILQKWNYKLTLSLVFGFTSSLVTASIGLLLNGITSSLIKVSVQISDGKVTKTELRDAVQIGWSWEKIEPTIVISCLLFGLALGAFIGLFIESRRIKAIEALKYSWEQTRNVFVSGLFLSGFCPFLFPLIILFISSLLSIKVDSVTIQKTPNQGIHRSATNAGISLAVSGLISGICGAAIFGLHDALVSLLVGGLCLLVGGLFSGLDNGGCACIQHLSLRLVLFLSRAIPWDYARFLNYATERMFLQRVGGRYRFIHKLLQEHMAKMGE